MLAEVLYGCQTTAGPVGFLLLTVNLTDEEAAEVAEHDAGNTTHDADGYAETQSGTGAVVALGTLQPYAFQPLLTDFFELGQGDVALHQWQQQGEQADVLDGLR